MILTIVPAFVCSWCGFYKYKLMN